MINFVEDFWEKSCPDRIFPIFLENFHLTEHQKEQILAAADSFLGLGSQKKVLANISPHSIIALIPADPSEQIGLNELSHRLVCIGRIPSKVDLAEYFTRSFGPLLKEETSEFQSVVLRRLHFQKGGAISYFTHRGVLVWAFEESVLHPCVYQLLQDLIPIRAGVTKHRGYSQLKRLAVRKTETFIYMRMEALRELFTCWGQEHKATLFPCPKEIAFYVNQTKRGRRYAMVALADQGDIAAFKKKNQLEDAVANAPIGRLSENTTFAFWTNWFKPQKFWERINQVDFAPMQFFLNWWGTDLKRLSGLSVPEFLGLFGNDFALYIDQMQSRGQYPRSLVSSSFAVKDIPQLSHILGQLTQKLRKEQVVSQGLKIVQFLMADGLLKPAYALGKHRLFLADSAELIERMHDKITLAGQHGKASLGFYGQRSNFFLFLRTGDMVEWVLPVVETIRHDFGRHYGNSFDDWLLFQPLVQSILTDLAKIETTRVRGFVGEKELFFEVSYTPKTH